MIVTRKVCICTQVETTVIQVKIDFVSVILHNLVFFYEKKNEQIHDLLRV